MAAHAKLLKLNEKYREKNYLKAQTSACCIYWFLVFICMETRNFVIELTSIG